MQCPNCHDQASKVIDSRPADNGESIRRRRECLSCHYRFNTYERVEQTPLLVVKRDGTREEFSRDKLLRGIIRSAEKRPVTHDQMNRLAQKVEEQIRKNCDREIPSRQIGEFVMPLLLDLDEVAYIRFASVYREFQSKEMFLKELKDIEVKKQRQLDQAVGTQEELDLDGSKEDGFK